MGNISLNIDIKRVWQICKKHMPEKAQAECYNELEKYIVECVTVSQSSDIVKQVMGE